MDYTEVHKGAVLETLLIDLTNLVTSKGGRVETIDFRRKDLAKIAKIVLPIGEEVFHFLTIIPSEEGKPYTIRIFRELMDEDRMPNHHGLLVLSTANSNKSYTRLFSPDMEIKKNWGALILPGGLAFLGMMGRVGEFKKPSEVGPIVIDLPKLTTREKLTKHFNDLCDFLNNPKENTHVSKLKKELEKYIQFE
ncbi:hypothetical protein [Neobacillus sp. NPDC093127]|uniref:hypothetical protein n=1 Tax=Neobacillus sp. NPDC093127 TaxID=3364296 RepID=UPI003820DEF2